MTTMLTPGTTTLARLSSAEESMDARNNVLFASEMVGAVRGLDPVTGHPYDDTKRYIEAAGLTDEQRSFIFEQNVRQVYPRLVPILDARRAAQPDDDQQGVP